MTTVAEKKAFVGGKWQSEVDLVDFVNSSTSTAHYFLKFST